MNRCLRPTLLSLALCAALPLHASEAEATTDAAATGAERSPTELAAVRVEAGKPKADTSRVNAEIATAQVTLQRAPARNDGCVAIDPHLDIVDIERVQFPCA